MNIKLSPSALSGTVSAISSKSDAHRILIAAALADAPTEVQCNVLSADIRATADCLCALGAHIEFAGGKILVNPVREAKDFSSLDCNESGSTLRFLLPLVSALGVNGEFTGRGRLPERPVTELRQAMEAHGVTFSPNGVFPIRTSGQLQAGKYILKGNVSSQYVTGLLFALPLLDGDSEIELLPPVESKAYIQMTLSTLRQFGIFAEQSENRFYIKGKQAYRSPKSVTVDGDWSNAAFFLTAGALRAPVTVTGLFADSIQGDKAVLDVLSKMGAKVAWQGNAVTVSPAPLRGVTVDASNIPDLVPILSVAAANADGVTEFQNAGRLRIKECDRLSAIAETLGTLGIRTEETADTLRVYGGTVQGGEVQGFNDHRMVMSAAIAASAAQGEVTVRGAQAIRKSYPHFFEDFKHLGGKANVLDS